MSNAEKFLVTGGNGFLGAWIVRQLLEEGVPVTTLDVGLSDQVLAQVLEPEQLSGLVRLTVDVTDRAAVSRAVGDSESTRIIHLAGLQVPACRADPVAGARVNVLGTLHVFEAARDHKGQVKSVVYASSAAVAGPVDDYSAPIPDKAYHEPRTQYGVFKLAGEGSARVYWLESGIPSAGIRPLSIFGVGRELGITSGPTKAIKAALLERPYTIGFSGTTGFHYVEDVAVAFIACARARLDGAHAFNLRGDILDVREFVRAVESVLPGAASLIQVSGPPLPIAYDVLQTGLDNVVGELPSTPTGEGIRRTVERFRELRSQGRLPDGDLDT